jgi:hypothetical protein
MLTAGTIKPGFVHIRAFFTQSPTTSIAPHTGVIARLDRAIQYSRTLVINRKAAAYWILRFRGV